VIILKKLSVTKKYVAFLRGINVGGHHKVPMAELRKELQALKFQKVITLLNSGNIIFEADPADPGKLEQKISQHLEKVFGFPVPTIVRKAELIDALLDQDPFKDIEVTKDIRLYISFLREDVQTDMPFPWTSEDGAFKILEKTNRYILSVLDLSISKTPKAMEVLEKAFRKENITTRNWNTIIRIAKKLDGKG
jgi:uncharacterized protein (DUF1697 family)